MNKNLSINKFIKILIASIVIYAACVHTFIHQAYSQTPTKKVTAASVLPTPSPTLDVVEKLKKIEVLKEKIATKVAQLRENEKGALAGSVKNINSNQIVIATRSDDRTITFSDDTVFYILSKEGKTETNLKKIKEGQSVTVFGYFDEKRETLSAKYIYLSTPKVRLTGKIADIDKTNYTLSVKEPQGTTTVDIEAATKTFLIGEDSKLAKGGFSKFKVGDIVHIQGTANPNKENTFTADRVIIISIQKITPKPTEV